MDENTESKKSSDTQTKKILLKLGQSSPRTLFFVSSAIVFLSYVKPIFSVWAYSDEYDFFEVIPKLGTHMTRDGNLISSIVYNYVSVPLINSIEDLWRLRILSFLCLFLILNHISSQIHTHNQSRSIQILLPIALTLPAPMTFISWSLIWQGSFAMLIAYIANVFWLNHGLRIKIISVLLLWLSILMSPVAAFSIFGFHAAFFILAGLKSANFFRTTRRLVILYVISGVSSLATLLISQNISGFKLNARVGAPAISDLPEKVYWIISRPIVVSMRFFDISSPSPVNALITTFLILSLLTCGFVIQSKNLNDSIFLRMTLFFTLILLSITPIAISWSNQIEFRYIFGPSIAFFLVSVVFILNLIKQYRRVQKFALIPTILFISLFGIITMNNHLYNQFIEPYKSKSNFIQSELSNCQTKNRFIEKIFIQQPKIGFPNRNNIGMFSQVTDLASPWVPVPSVQYTLKTLNLSTKEIVLQDYVDEKNLNSCVIDLNKYNENLVIMSGKS